MARHKVGHSHHASRWSWRMELMDSIQSRVTRPTPGRGVGREARNSFRVARLRSKIWRIRGELVLGCISERRSAGYTISNTGRRGTSDFNLGSVDEERFPAPPAGGGAWQRHLCALSWSTSQIKHQAEWPGSRRTGIALCQPAQRRPDRWHDVN